MRLLPPSKSRSQRIEEVVENVFDVYDYDIYDSHAHILGMDLFYSLSVLIIWGIPFSQILRIPVPES